MSLYRKLLIHLRNFTRDRRGAFAVSFVMFGAFLLGFAALGLEGSRYVTERARLSDAMEQAALALTAEDNGDDTESGKTRNDILAVSWLSAYMHHANSVDKPVIRVLQGSVNTNHKLAYVEYRLSSRVQQNSWFSSSLFPSFNKQVKVGDNGAARKFRSNIDVAFVVDFSGSMLHSIENEFGNKDRPWKLDVAKEIVINLSQQLASYNIDNKVAFVPFGWGTRRGDFCTPQFVLMNGKIDSMGDFTAEKLYYNVDYAETIRRIPQRISDINIPIDKANNLFCLRYDTPEDSMLPGEIGISPETVELTRNPKILEGKIRNMIASDATLVSSGILDGVQVLSKGNASRKVLVIVSDGEDQPRFDNGVTDELLKHGLCDKIREVLTTDYSVGKIAFIALKYEKATSDWERCVGSNNFYTAHNLFEFEHAMNRAVFEEVGHNTTKDH